MAGSPFPGWDPFEDPLSTPLPEPREWAEPGLDEDPWITGRSLSEIFALELSITKRSASCPRCGRWVFHYGRLLFCSHGCPENLLAV